MSTSIKSVFVPRLLGRTNRLLQVDDTYLNEKSEMNQGPITRSYRWYQELVESSADGYTKEFDLSMDPYDSVNMLMIFVNGLLQRYGIDYRTFERTIIFNNNLRTGSNIIAIYNYK